MDVFTRHQNEGLTLVTHAGEIIKIEVINAQHGCVRLNIDAPIDALIIRDEMLRPVSPNGQALIHG